jgi:hypothetical protein
MLLVLFTLEDFIRVRKLSPAGIITTGGLHVEDTKRAPYGIPWAKKWPAVRACGSIAIRTLGRRRCWGDSIESLIGQRQQQSAECA